MKRLRWLALCAAALLLTGCYPLFLQPLFKEKDLVTDAALAGVWQKAGSEETWTIEGDGGKGYRVTRKEGQESERLLVRLGRLGAARFLEMRGEKNPEESQSIPGYSFWRVRLEGDALEVLPLKPEYFEGLIQAGQLEMAQVVRGEFVVFTGTTAQVRGFLEKRVEDEAMYQEPERYRRMGAAAVR
jgi:hypothetical protein